MNSTENEPQRDFTDYFFQNDATPGGAIEREDEDDRLGLAAGLSFALDITCLGAVLLIAVILFINPENPWVWLPVVWLMVAVGLQLIVRTLAALR